MEAHRSALVKVLNEWWYHKLRHRFEDESVLVNINYARCKLQVLKVLVGIKNRIIVSVYLLSSKISISLPKKTKSLSIQIEALRSKNLIYLYTFINPISASQT